MDLIHICWELLQNVIMHNSMILTSMSTQSEVIKDSNILKKLDSRSERSKELK